MASNLIKPVGCHRRQAAPSFSFDITALLRLLLLPHPVSSPMIKHFETNFSISLQRWQPTSTIYVRLDFGGGLLFVVLGECEPVHPRGWGWCCLQRFFGGDIFGRADRNELYRYSDVVECDDLTVQQH